MLRRWRRGRKPHPLYNPDGSGEPLADARAYRRGGWVLLVGGAVLAAAFWLVTGCNGG